MARYDKSDMPGIGIVDGKPNVVDRDAPRWRPEVLDDADAVSKSDAKYREATTDATRCARCTMFVASNEEGEPSRCTKVRGPVAAAMVCDLFESAL